MRDMSEKTIILVDVDTQFDFVDPQGTLHVPAPQGTLARIRERLAHAQTRGEVVLGSVEPQLGRLGVRSARRALSSPLREGTTGLAAGDAEIGRAHV